MSDFEIDPNTIAAEFLSQRLDSLVDGMKGLVKGARNQVRLRLDRTYRLYLTALATKYSRTKSFMLRGESAPLYQFYVPLDLEVRARRVAAANVVDVLELAPHMIVSGSGGSGKSMLVRHLLLDALARKLKVPIFIELREFNSFDGGLLDLIEKTLRTFHLDLGLAYVVGALRAGHFLIFLDGFDEIAYDKRDRVAKYILDFVDENPLNNVIVTSRQDPALAGWQDFVLHGIAPLTLEQAGTIVERLPFDAEMKARFVADLHAKLFESHRSFVSNPLLLSIMLLSYGQSAGIPSKVSVFYYQAYEALFERHDALKDGYRRHLRSGLDIQDFARLFAGFCLRAYDKSQIEFSKAEALEHIASAQDLVGVRVDRNCYFHDLTESVCLLVVDGLQIVYPHRSFQEYFAARFICDAQPAAQEQLVTRYAKRAHTVRTDALFTMVHEMRPDLVERYYLIPGLRNLLTELKILKSVGDSHAKRFQRLLIRELIPFDERVGFSVIGSAAVLFETARFALSKYGNQVGYEFGESPIGPAESALVAEGLRSRLLDQSRRRLGEQSKKRPSNIGWRGSLASAAAKLCLEEWRASERSIFSLKALRALQEIEQLILDKARSGEQSLEDMLTGR